MDRLTQKVHRPLPFPCVMTSNVFFFREGLRQPRSAGVACSLYGTQEIFLGSRFRAGGSFSFE